MKKIILVFAFVAVAISSNAQAWLGGNAGLSLLNSDGTTVVQLSAAPMFRYDINEKFAVGIEVADQFTTEDDYSTNTIAVSPFLRYNCCKVGSGRFFLQAGIAYGFTSFEDFDETAKTFAVGFNPGFSFPLSNRAEFEVSLGGISWANSSAYGESTSVLRLDILQNISIGFAFKL